jgi:poly-gamma-glutamate synthesis protein (capsule biosynthesis protein)
MTLALAGDTMLGRGVARHLSARPRLDSVVAPEIQAVFAEADLRVLNLECCVSDRGEQWPDPDKPFFFRAPPVAAGLLAELGVDCVTLANNHALDYGVEALADTRTLLARAGVSVVGAGAEIGEARRPAVLETAGGLRLSVIGATDHPRVWAAGPDRPGVAWADLPSGVAHWLLDEVAEAAQRSDAVLVTPHWGPNMTIRPLAYVRTAADRLLAAGATLVAGHSAHLVHAATARVLYDLGDFVDDYAVDPRLRNDLGLVFLVTLEENGSGPPGRLEPTGIRALPIVIEGCRARPAEDEEWEWIRDRFTRASAEFGGVVTVRGRWLVIR